MSGQGTCYKLGRRADIKTPIDATTSSTVGNENDSADNLVTQTASGGQVTSYGYDKANRRETETYPDSGVRTFTYDGVGNVATRIDQKGDLTEYFYDDLHRLIERDYTLDGGSDSWPATQGPDTFDYDRVGRLKGAERVTSESDVMLQFEYDALNRITYALQDGLPTSFDYDVSTSGFWQQTTYPAGRVVRHNLDQRGRVASVQNIVDGTPTLTYAENTYDLANRLKRRDFGNGTHMEREYDDAHRVIRDAHFFPPVGENPAVAFDDRTYGRDKPGNREWMRQDVSGMEHLSETYTYDRSHRLTSMERGELDDGFPPVVARTTLPKATRSQVWNLDRLGNWSSLTAERMDAGTNVLELTDARTHNTVNEITSRVIDYGTDGWPLTVPVDYDSNGNLSRDWRESTNGEPPGTELRFDYDAENRLTRVRRVTDDDPYTDVVVTEYTYDALGRRVGKTVTNSGDLNGDFTWVWSPGWQLLEEWEMTLAPLAIFNIREFIHAGPTAYVDDHVAMIDHDYSTSGPAYYYHADHMACTLAMTDESGDVVERYLTDAYGKATVYDANWENPTTDSTVGNPFRHQGLAWDSETEHYHNRFRQVAPTLGSFVQRDPAGFVDGPGLVVYLASAPLTWIDPLGLEIILGIHSNVTAQGSSANGSDNGHAWISRRDTTTGEQHTYGLWPDGHALVRQLKLNNGPGSDVRTDLEKQYDEPYVTREYRLTDAEAQELQRYIESDAEWKYVTNCAHWASTCVERVKHEKVPCEDPGALGVRTPRMIGKWIIGQNMKDNKKEKQNADPGSGGRGSGDSKCTR